MKPDRAAAGDLDRSADFWGAGTVTVAITGLLLTAAATVWLDRVASESGRRVFGQMTQQYGDQLDSRFESLVTRLVLARDLAHNAGQLTVADWETWFNRNVGHDFDDIVAFGYFTAVHPGERPAHEASIRARYCPEYAVHRAAGRGLAPDSPSSPVPDDVLLLPLTHVVFGAAAPAARPPLTRCLGSEMLAAPPDGSDAGEDRATLWQAINSRTVQATGVIELPSATAADPPLRVVRLYFPVFHALPGHEDTTNLEGVIFTTVNLQAAARSYFGNTPPPIGMEVQVRNGDGTWSQLASTTDTFPSAARRPDARFTTSDEDRFFSRARRCEFWSTPEFEPGANVHLWFSSGLGLVFTSLVTGFVWYQGRARRNEAIITNELRTASARLTTVTRERERLSRDLHDGTIQSIYALGLDLQRVRRLIDREPESARVEITRTLAMLNSVVTELREFILQVESGPHQAQNADTVLNALVDRLRPTTDAEITLKLAPDAARLLPPRQVVEVLQIVREALTNSLRHGQPTQVSIALSREAADWRLTIADNGAGFEPQRPNGRHGHGLRNLSDRAAELGGECQIVSAPGAGAAVRVVFPALTDPVPGAEEVPST